MRRRDVTGREAEYGRALVGVQTIEQEADGDRAAVLAATHDAVGRCDRFATMRPPYAIASLPS